MAYQEIQMDFNNNLVEVSTFKNKWIKNFKKSKSSPLLLEKKIKKDYFKRVRKKLRRRNYLWFQKKKKFKKNFFNRKDFIVMYFSPQKVHSFLKFYFFLYFNKTKSINIEINYFLKTLIGSFTKNGKRSKVEKIISKAFKYICLKFNITLFNLVFFLYNFFQPLVYLKPYFRWKKKVFTCSLVKTFKRRSTVICFIIKQALMKRTERTLFLRFISELNTVFLNKKESFIFIEKKKYREAIINAYQYDKALLLIATFDNKFKKGKFKKPYVF